VETAEITPRFPYLLLCVDHDGDEGLDQTSFLFFSLYIYIFLYITDTRIYCTKILLKSVQLHSAMYVCIHMNAFSCSYQMKVNESEKSIAEHESLHENILNLEKWLMIMRQKLESFRGSDGEWSIDNRQHEAEVRLCATL